MPNPSKVESKTTIDLMFAMLKEKGKMDVKSLSIALNISPSVIDDWAKILESGGFVNITNEFGHMFITSLKSEFEQDTAISEIINVQKTKAIQDVEFGTLKVDELKAKIDSIQKDTSELERQFSKDFPKLHTYLNELEIIFKRSSEMSKSLDNLKRRANKEYKETITKFDAEYKEIQEVVNKSMDTKKIYVLIEDARKFEFEIDKLKNSKRAEIDSLKKETEEHAKLLKKTIDDVEKDIDAGIKTTTKQIKEELKNLEEWDSLLKKTNDKLPSLINEQQAQFNKFSKLKEDITKMYRDIESSTEQILDEYTLKLEPIYEGIDKVKRELSEPGDIGNTIINAKSEISEIQKEITSLKNEFVSITKDLKNISTNKKLSNETKLSKVDDMAKRNDNFKDKITKIDSRMKGVTKLLSLIGIKKEN